jgi:hypothetical protein
VANEGVRISTIVQFLRKTQFPAGQDTLANELIETFA